MDNSHFEHMKMCAVQETEMVKQEIALVSGLSPEFGVDGDQFFFLLGKDLQSGVAGFGSTPHAAMLNFNRNFYNQKIVAPAEATNERG